MCRLSFENFLIGKIHLPYRATKCEFFLSFFFSFFLKKNFIFLETSFSPFSFPFIIARYPSYSLIPSFSIYLYDCPSCSSACHLSKIELISYSFPLHLAAILPSCASVCRFTSFLLFSYFFYRLFVSFIQRRDGRSDYSREENCLVRLLPSKAYLLSAALFLMNSDMKLPRKEFNQGEKNEAIWI